MSTFSQSELSAMQATQEAHMMDAGQILFWSAGAADGYGVPVATYTAGPEIACGFEFANQTDEAQGETDVPVVDAKLRLALSEAIGSDDRFRLTKRFGAVVINTDYEIVGEPRLGPSGWHIDLAQVTEK